MPTQIVIGIKVDGSERQLTDFWAKEDSHGQKWTVDRLEFYGTPAKSERFINIHMD